MTYYLWTVLAVHPNKISFCLFYSGATAATVSAQTKPQTTATSSAQGTAFSTGYSSVIDNTAAVKENSTGLSAVVDSTPGVKENTTLVPDNTLSAAPKSAVGQLKFSSTEEEALYKAQIEAQAKLSQEIGHTGQQNLAESDLLKAQLEAKAKLNETASDENALLKAQLQAQAELTGQKIQQPVGPPRGFSTEQILPGMSVLQSQTMPINTAMPMVSMPSESQANILQPSTAHGMMAPALNIAVNAPLPSLPLPSGQVLQPPPGPIIPPPPGLLPPPPGPFIPPPPGLFGPPVVPGPLGPSGVQPFTSTEPSAPQQFTSAVANAPQQFTSTVASAPQQFTSVVTSAPQQFTSTVPSAPQQFTSAVPSASQQFTSTVASAPHQFTSTVARAQQQFTSVVTSAPQQFASTVTIAPQQFTPTVASAPQQFTPTVASAPQQFTSTVASAPQQFNSTVVGAPLSSWADGVGSVQSNVVQPTIMPEGPRTAISPAVIMLDAGVSNMEPKTNFQQEIDRNDIAEHTPSTRSTRYDKDNASYTKLDTFSQNISSNRDENISSRRGEGGLNRLKESEESTRFSHIDPADKYSSGDNTHVAKRKNMGSRSPESHKRFRTEEDSQQDRFQKRRSKSPERKVSRSPASRDGSRGSRDNADYRQRSKSDQRSRRMSPERNSRQGRREERHEDRGSFDIIPKDGERIVRRVSPKGSPVMFEFHVDRERERGGYDTNQNVEYINEFEERYNRQFENDIDEFVTEDFEKLAYEADHEIGDLESMERQMLEADLELGQQSYRDNYRDRKRKYGKESSYSDRHERNFHSSRQHARRRSRSPPYRKQYDDGKAGQPIAGRSQDRYGDGQRGRIRVGICCHS